MNKHREILEILSELYPNQSAMAEIKITVSKKDVKDIIMPSGTYVPWGEAQPDQVGYMILGDKLKIEVFAV